MVILEFVTFEDVLFTKVWLFVFVGLLVRAYSRLPVDQLYSDEAALDFGVRDALVVLASLEVELTIKVLIVCFSEFFNQGVSVNL